MVITALVSRVEVEVFRIDDRADFNRFGIDHDATELVGIDSEVFINLGKMAR